MQHFARAVTLFGLLLLAGCASSGSQISDIGPTLNRPNPDAAISQPSALPAPSQQIASAQAMTDVSSFLDPAVLSLLSARDRNEASSAQFNALQFGRAGAPRSWQGDRGATGQVIVGPPVPVNNLYCRTFTHSVKVGTQDYSKSGMACREADGRWTVEDA